MRCLADGTAYGDTIRTGFNLTLWNHNLKSVEDVSQADAVIVAGDETFTTSSLDSFSQTNVFPPLEAFQVVVLADACGDMAMWTDQSASGIDIFCSALLPDGNADLGAAGNAWSMTSSFPLCHSGITLV